MLQQSPFYEATGIIQHATFVDTQPRVAVVERSSAPLAASVLLISYFRVQQFSKLVSISFAVTFPPL